MTIIDKIVKGDIAPRDTGVLWLNTEDNIIYVFRNGWIKTSTGAAASVYTGTEAERLAIEDPFNGLEFHQVDNDGKVTRYLYDMNSWTIVIDPAEYIIRADQDHARAEADHTAAASDHSAATQDHSLAVVDHQNAVDDHAQYLVDHESIAHKANVDGYYGQMTVGAAENLVGDSEETYTFTTQMTGGEVEFGSGAGQLTKVQGNGLAWNQLARNGDFSDGTSHWTNLNSSNTSLAVSNNILTGTVLTDTYKVRIGQTFTNPIPKGHKIYWKFDYFGHYSINPDNQILFRANVGNGLVFTAEDVQNDIWIKYSGIGVLTADVVSVDLFSLSQTETGVLAGDYAKFKDIILIDLSLIFGLGNEPATVEDAEARLAALVPQKPYYQYNAGELYGTKVLHLISYGQNLLNPANGLARLAPYSYESVVNKYGIAAKAGVTLGTITFTHDATGVAETITPDSNGQFTISGAGTLNVAVSAGSLADVYVWAVYDGAKNGIENFVPFQQDAVEIKASEVYGKLNGTGEYVKVFADNVMRSSGVRATDVHDLIDLQSMTADVNVGKAILKDLLWKGGYSGAFYVTEDLANIIACPVYSGAYPNAESNCLTGYNWYYFGTAPLFSVAIGKHWSGNPTLVGIRVDREAFPDAASLVSYLNQNNAVLWYELATPKHYTDLKLSSDGGETFRDLPTTIAVDNWGVWQQKPSEGLTPATGHDFEGIAATISTILPMDAVEILKSVQDNGIMTSEQRAQLTNILTALQVAGIIGNFTIAETPTDKVFPITVTAPVEPEEQTEPTE